MNCHSETNLYGDKFSEIGRVAVLTYLDRNYCFSCEEIDGIISPGRNEDGQRLHSFYPGTLYRITREHIQELKNFKRRCGNIVSPRNMAPVHSVQSENGPGIRKLYLYASLIRKHVKNMRDIPFNVINSSNYINQVQKYFENRNLTLNDVEKLGETLQLVSLFDARLHPVQREHDHYTDASIYADDITQEFSEGVEILKTRDIDDLNKKVVGYLFEIENNYYEPLIEAYEELRAEENNLTTGVRRARADSTDPPSSVDILDQLNLMAAAFKFEKFEPEVA
jgi:hypothetical protein